MSDVVRNDGSEGSSPREIRERAAIFLLKQREYVWTDRDQNDLDIWFKENLAHRIAYLRLETAWDSADRLAILRKPALATIMAAPERPRATFVKIVAGLVSVVLGVVAALYLGRSGKQIYSTQIGQQRAIVLADGSQIELNTDTSLAIGKGENYRQVSLLRGEAYFRIKHDAAHSFVITIGEHRVVDLGTEFSVKDTLAQVQVALVKGRARFESATSPNKSASVVLAPGDVAVASENSAAVRLIEKKTVLELADDLGWRRGVLVFKRAALGEVVAEFNRYSRDKLVVSDSSVGNLTISGTFPTGGAATFSRAAQEAFGLHVQRYGDQTVISR